MSELFNALKIRFFTKYYIMLPNNRRLWSFSSLIWSFLMLVLFNACTEGVDEEQPPTPDVSNIQVQSTVRRFDRAMFSMDTVRFAESMQALELQFPAFLPFFVKEVAHDPSQPQETPQQALYGFVTAPQVRRLNDSCQAAFPDMSVLQKDLKPLLQYYKYYFPQRKEPVTITAVTEFIGDVFMVNDTTMMLGLDMFLGENFEGYNPDIFPQYLRKQFVPGQIIVKYAFELANSAIPAPAKDQILDHIVRNGKVLYIMDCLLPTVPDSIKMGYTTEQWKGCYANEQEIWARLLDMKVLYEPLNTKNMKIVTAGPSTDNVFQEAPGQVGNWIGWQIVKAYMKRQPDTKLPDLAKLNDAQMFVEKAKYKPRKR